MPDPCAALSGCGLSPVAQGLHTVLLAVGILATTVSGVGGLLLALHAMLVRNQKQRLDAGILMALLRGAQRLALLLTMGAGLAMGAAGTWLVLGTLRTGDPRLDWLAVSWLVQAAGILAWSLAKHKIRWAASLAALATGCALLGLSAVPALFRRLGF